MMPRVIRTPAAEILCNLEDALMEKESGTNIGNGELANEVVDE